MAGAATALVGISTLTTLHSCQAAPSSHLKLPPHILQAKQVFRYRRPTCCSGHGKINGVVAEEASDELDDEEEEEDEDQETSVDLLVRFVQSVVRGVSKRAKKGLVSVLPPEIPPQLVKFAVDGVLLLAVLSIAKALLEVACNLGGTVLFVILFLRLIWSTISHFQSAETGGNYEGIPNTM